MKDFTSTFMPLDLQTYTEYIDVKVSAVHASNSTPKMKLLGGRHFRGSVKCVQERREKRKQLGGGQRGRRTELRKERNL